MPFQARYTLWSLNHSHKFRHDLKGLNLPDCHSALKLSIYADDLIVFVDSQQDINMLIADIAKFSFISSAKVNWEKSEAFNFEGRVEEKQATKRAQLKNWWDKTLGDFSR